jgi:GcrA cell cycle regulator
MYGRSWTNDEIAQLRTLWVSHLSVDKIGEQINDRTRSSITTKAHALKLGEKFTVSDRQWPAETLKKLASLWDQGLSASEIGQELGFSRSAIIGKAHRMNLSSRRELMAWTPEQAAILKTMWRAKAPVVEIAAKLGLSENAVRRKASKMRMQRTRKQGPRDYKPRPAALPFEPKQAESSRPLIRPGFGFCGHPSADLLANRPYCCAHMRIAGNGFGNSFRTFKAAA